MRALGCFLLVSCGSEPDRAPSSVEVTAMEAAPVHDQGQKAPPLPPDLPIWHQDAGGFVADHHWYGEPDWDGVRLRVLGHFAWTARELARDQARTGDVAGALQTWTTSASRLAKVSVHGAGPARDVQQVLVAQAQDNIALLHAIQGKSAPDTAIAAAGELGTLRRQTAQLGRAATADAAAADALSERLAHLRKNPPYRLDLDDFANFDDRHQLRVSLWGAWAAASGPLSGVRTWGYWTAASWDAELVRAEAVVHDVQARREASAGPLDATALLEAFTTPAQDIGPPALTVAGLAALPTGDSLIDVAGQPGPRAIGTLVKMGTDDAAYQAWLEERSTALAAAPNQTVALVRDMVRLIDAHTHGSRYYNVKQVRNAGVRQLALNGDYADARAILSDNWPLHNQDWACPNRAGILTALDGVLALAGGNHTEGQDQLRTALQQGEAFLAQVDEAARKTGQGQHQGPGQSRPQGRPQGPPRR